MTLFYSLGNCVQLIQQTDVTTITPRPEMTFDVEFYHQMVTKVMMLLWLIFDITCYYVPKNWSEFFLCLVIAFEFRVNIISEEMKCCWNKVMF
jgi:hypothetical protein